jgi:hypothetical protein
MCGGNGSWFGESISNTETNTKASLDTGEEVVLETEVEKTMFMALVSGEQNKVIVGYGCMSYW